MQAAFPSFESGDSWVITDGAAGNQRQALALARAMGLQPSILPLQLRAPWVWFAPHLLTGAHFAVPAAMRERFKPPWPALAIGCGRQAALLARALRHWSSGATFTLQLLDPRIASVHYDLVIAPQHDGVRGDNVIQTLGALNPVDASWLDEAAMQFSSLAQLPAPRTALLVGGPHRQLMLNTRWLDKLIAHLEVGLKREGGSLMISTSRRTPPQWRTRLRGAFNHGSVCFWDSADDGANPYAGFLAHAERIVVTPDSVNMLSEACATGKPVFTLLPPSTGGKLAAFHAALHAQGRLCNLGNENYTFKRNSPLRETAEVAAEVWRRLGATKPQAAAALRRHHANGKPNAAATSSTTAV